MNYYIDFDHTLFDTQKLTNRMLKAIADTSKMDIIEECKAMFTKDHIYNIYKLATYFANKYNLNEKELIIAINDQINNCSDIVFSDVLPFLKKLKQKGHNIYMLSYSDDNIDYQTYKIASSKITDMFNGIIITKEPKYNLDIEYKNGIFIDDKPKDLMGLYSKNPFKVIRLRRNGQKYSDKNMDENIAEYENFNEIPIE